jgi:UDP-N-acetylglucosamine--N-acetylmuramyl-(pentapeptide) pyrophosphoryl-undecaprenol N-acetylglucosamine transferase
MSRCIMIMAGGTGGHVFPALDVAEELMQRGWKIVWLGTKAGIEAKLVVEKGIDIEWVYFSGLRGKGILKTLLLPSAIMIAYVQSLKAIIKRKPNVLLGMGGYASFPGGMMAVFLNKPLIIHEQNSVAGLTNRVLGSVAKKVLVGFPNAFKNPSRHKLASMVPSPKEVLWVGNPVRTQIAQCEEPTTRYANREGNLRLLIIGGSQGAQALNDTVPKALALIDEKNRPLVVHQAGAKHIEALQQNYDAAGIKGELVPFINDMAEKYAWSDLVVCRSGALTVAELTAAGAASILIPYPSAVDDHQATNAKFLVDAGAADLLTQKELTPEKLATLIQSKTRALLQTMAEKARSLAKLDATEKVADICVKYAI